MIECRECRGNNFIKKFCHVTERFVYDDCWDCLSEEMYQAELEEKMKVIISNPSEDILNLVSKVLVKATIENKNEMKIIWKELRD